MPRCAWLEAANPPAQNAALSRRLFGRPFQILDNAMPPLRRRLFVLGFVTLLPVCGSAQQSVQQGYSTAPLRDPIFDVAGVLVETTAINNWLNSNYKGLSYQEMKGPREHLYYLIDSRVKDTFSRTGRIYPAEHDVILELLFSWAERLGAYGGSLVYNRLRSRASRELPTQLRAPKGMSIELNDDLLKVQSVDGRWSVAFPYYFMLWNVADFNAKNGLRTQIIALSTGAAKDKSQAGHSQATLLLIFSPGADTNIFLTSWRQQLSIGVPKEEKVLPVRGLRAQHRFDPQNQLHTEFVGWTEKQGPFAVVYTGIEGTYQWNRLHFLDFLRALQIQ